MTLSQYTESRGSWKIPVLLLQNLGFKASTLKNSATGDTERPVEGDRWVISKNES